MDGGDRRLQRVPARRPGAQRRCGPARRPRRSRPGPTASGPGRRAAAAARPASVRVARRASVSSSSASSPATSADSGSRLCSIRARSQRPLDEVAAHEVVADRRGVPGREQQVHDLEHGGDARRQLGRRRHAVRDARAGDLLLGPGDPRGHRRLADQERARHLGRRQAAQQPQRQRDLRVDATAPGGSRCRSAAAGRPGSRRRRSARAAARRRPSPAPASPCGTSASRRNTSSARLRAVVVSHAAGRRGIPLVRPRRQRPGVGVLHALLGEVEVARDAHRRGEHEAPLATVRVGDRGRDRRATIGRIS